MIPGALRCRFTRPSAARRHLDSSKKKVESAKEDAGKKGKDGISYLISVKRQGIKTPLMEEYEESILGKLGVETLEDAQKVLISKKTR